MPRKGREVLQGAAGPQSGSQSLPEGVCSAAFVTFDGPQTCGRPKGHPGTHTKEPLSYERARVAPDKILTAQVGTNAELVRDAVKLYIPDGARVADITYGKGVFWQQVDTERFTLLSSDLSDGVDLRALPYDDDSLDVIVLDPPYIYNPKDTVKKSIATPYAVNNALGLTTISRVIDLYAGGIGEARRCLKKGGVLMLKCQDQIESGKQRWVHIELYEIAVQQGFYGRDLFVLVQRTRPAIRWPNQKHARKNHSYLWVLELRAA